MDLRELFPEEIKVIIAGKEYPVIFDTRAMLQIETDYPDIVFDKEMVRTQTRISEVIQSLLTGVKISDLVNLLYAGLLSTKAFLDKETIIDLIKPCDFNVYADRLLAAYMQAQLTQEQIDKLTVMSEANGDKKKPEGVTEDENIPSIEPNAG